jgi:hypothetical protein
MSTSSYTYGSIYNVQITPGTTWTPNTTLGTVTDPGIASSTICVLQNVGLGQSLISTTALSGASVTISSIPAGFSELLLHVYGMTNATANGNYRIQINAANFSVYTKTEDTSVSTVSGNLITTTSALLRTDARNMFTLRIAQPSNSAINVKSFQMYGSFVNSASAWSSLNIAGIDNSGTNVGSIVISNTGGSMTAGTAYLYGVR